MALTATVTGPHGLLLDLDGVVVLEARAPGGEQEILRLHPDLAGRLSALGLPVIVLTHRSRAEARVILEAAGLPMASLHRLVAAEDLCLEALRRLRIRALLRGGLRKSFALSLVERRDGFAPADLAVIDDKPANLDDLRRHGVGLALLAPAQPRDAAAGVIGFDFAEAACVIARWIAGARPDVAVRLTPRTVRLAAWQRTGLSTASSGRHWFNTVRALGASARTLAGAK
ncbi:MAG: hypothetical protein JO021_02735 [Alphaproteobacteria bacterium]|nr:hypothetical protein [Alphaproteobacteria bacterium]